MEIPSYLRGLHEAYRRLDCVDPRRLSEDQTRSLRYFQADVAAGPVDVSARVVRWVAIAHEVDAYLAMHGRPPRRNSRRRQPLDTSARRLAGWFEDQRRPSAKARQCSYQRRRIALFPGVDARDRDQRWQDALDAYRRFLESEGRAPSARATDGSERRLAGWAAKQRCAYRAGQLCEERTALLGSLPMWTWGSAKGPGR